jgi:hypothetical protein
MNRNKPEQAMESISILKVLEASKEFKDVAIETSTRVNFHNDIINIQSVQHSDKDTSCIAFHEEELKNTGVNAETDTIDMVHYQTPRQTKDFGAQEIDFRLTDSKEMDHKYRSMFSTDKKENRYIYFYYCMPIIIIVLFFF